MNVRVGDRWLGSLLTDDIGSFVFNLLTETAGEGVFTVEALQGSSVGSQVVALSADSTMYQREGAAPSLRLSAAATYLPVVNR